MKGTCTNCEEQCTVLVLDFGIGAYEYHGARGVDIQEEAVSDCCEDVAVNDAGNPITIRDIEDFHFDPPEDW